MGHVKFENLSEPIHLSFFSPLVPEDGSQDSRDEKWGPGFLLGGEERAPFPLGMLAQVHRCKRGCLPVGLRPEEMMVLTPVKK